MDTKPREIESESFVLSQLLRYGFKTAKPSFDQKGADLLILEGYERQYFRFLKVQSKGREISNPTSVKILVDYVDEQFILFIYAVEGDNEPALYMFFADEIKKWKVAGDSYVFNITKAKLIADYSDNLFTKKRALRIKYLLSNTKVKKYTSIFIDGIFLEKAIKKTKVHYSDIWPEKELKQPDLQDVVRNILDHYDLFKSEIKTINCYLYLSGSFYLEGSLDMSAGNQSFETVSGNEVNIFVNRSDNMIAFEILEQMERVINSENIVLVADDITYEQELNEHHERGEDIIVVCFDEDDGGRMITGFRWGDVVYPIALAMGILRHEL